MGVLDLLTVLRWLPLLASNKRRGGEPWCHTALRYFYSPYAQYILCEHSSDSYNIVIRLWLKAGLNHRNMLANMFKMLAECWPTCCVRLSTMVQHLPRFLYFNSWAYFYLYMVFCRDKENAGSLLNLIMK